MNQEAELGSSWWQDTKLLNHFSLFIATLSSFMLLGHLGKVEIVISWNRHFLWIISLIHSVNILATSVAVVWNGKKIWFSLKYFWPLQWLIESKITKVKNISSFESLEFDTKLTMTMCQCQTNFYPLLKCETDFWFKFLLTTNFLTVLTFLSQAKLSAQCLFDKIKSKFIKNISTIFFKF